MAVWTISAQEGTQDLHSPSAVRGDDRGVSRGRLKVFLGMAAGVGKTYRMLQEGRAQAAAGVDVVVGLLETHRRAETTALGWDLEVLPRQRVEYRGTLLEDMDLPALLRRAPELALIDELAHTNAPGLKHPKRYDIEDVLAAGIDVYSTLNVQHLESLNDQVAEMSGIVVRETIPDSVLQHADEIVLVDLTPEALLERLGAGKVYPPERVGAALNGFFTVENLQALRETALRQVAEEVGQRRVVEQAPVVGTREDRMEHEGAAAAAERLLALVEPQPSAQRLVRRAWRSAQRLAADLDVLWVRPPGDHSEEHERQLNALRHLTSMLGANLLVEEGADIVQTAARVVRERGTTYILVGESPPRRGLARLREPLPQRLMHATPPGVDVRIVADRARRHEPPA
jgi:two-component system sensor histidine kinase KdpD